MEEFDLSDLISEEDLAQFRTDVRENLNDLEEALLQLEATPDDLELVGRVFRAMHTIKGTSSMYGFEEASRLTHHIEGFYDRVRNGQAGLTREVIDLTLAARDQVAAMILQPGQSGDPLEMARIREGFAAFSAQPRETWKNPCAAAQEALVSREKGYVVRFRFQPDLPIFRRATNPLVYLQGLRGLGVCSVVCHLDGVPPLEGLDPGVCHLEWEVVLHSQGSSEEIRGEFLFVEDELARLEIFPLLPEEHGVEAMAPPRLGEILMAQGQLAPEALEEVLRGKPRIGETLIARGKVSESRVRAALQQQQGVKECLEKAEKDNAIASVRVCSDKLDGLVNQVGELVIAQARLRQILDQGQEHPELLAVAEEISRLTEELRDSTMGIRMLPIGTLFARFNRLVRDLARELGKEVELVTQGGETELDKTVIENLSDPLVHLLRNSIDHGLESPEERKSAGKPGRGLVRLSALHSGASVLVRIEDDGRGLDAHKIRAKAVARGLIPEEANPPEQDLYNLIFLPGFSTAEAVTSVSGRGVGMDVVKRTIDGLRGAVEIQSKAGRGTILTLKLPLTLAIIDGFLVQSAGEQFVLPLSTVKECVKLTREDLRHAHGRQLINIRNEIVPYVRLREIFHLEGEAPTGREQVVITEVDRHRMGMVVDRVVGQSQVVIKSLGEVFRHVAEFSGATILGDGRVVPILDVGRILDSARLLARS